MTSSSRGEDPHVEVTLSRPAYRLGSTVVGTVRVTTTKTSSSENDSSSHHHHHHMNNSRPPPREALHSLDLCVTGRCRLDPRWHNTTNVKKEYQQQQQQQQRRLSSKEAAASSLPLFLQEMPLEPDAFCFWATEPIALLDLHERQEGRWDESKPKPIRLPGIRRKQQQQRLLRPDSSSLEDYYSDEPPISRLLEDQQLAFSFRVDLPTYLPHSVNCTSCRYYYVIVIRLKQTSEGKPRWIQKLITVLTATDSTDADLNKCTSAATKNNNDSQHEGTTAGAADGGVFQMSATTTTTTACRAMAHSSGLPCYLTATELHQPGGQLTVNRDGVALYRHVRRHDPRHLQTMRVCHPSSGRPVCVLTLLGATPLHPGSSLIVKVDFPINAAAAEQQGNHDNDNNNNNSWVPCYQVSACLQGEETVLRKDGSRQRARSHLFDAAHDYVDPDCTERTCLDLMLPLNAPCTIQTDVLEISIHCLIEITIARNNEKANGSDGYQTLRLEIPCQVVNGISAYERNEEDDDDARQAFSIDGLLGYESSERQQEIDPKDPASFQTKDITDELKILSLLMADRCGLKPKPLD